MLVLAAGATMTCAEAVSKLLRRKTGREVRSAGKGSKGERWYARAWLAAASPRHSLLVRRHLRTGQLAFHYCYVPAGRDRVESLPDQGRRTALAGRGMLRSSPKGSFGPDQCQARLSTAIRRGHNVLVMAALAVCAVTAAMLRDRAGTRAPPPAGPHASLPADPGLVPLTVPEIRRLLTAALTRPAPPGHAARWLQWRRRHQARSAWFHQRARLQRNYSLVS